MAASSKGSVYFGRESNYSEKLTYEKKKMVMNDDDMHGS